MEDMKELVKTGVRLPAMGMGTFRMGGERSPDYSRDEEVIRVLRVGIDLGLNLIDTAERYAAGHCEELVGKAVKGIRDRVFIITKVSPENLAHNDVLEAAERSLKRLGTDYIDLYMVHTPNPEVPAEQRVRAMEKLVEQGKVRFVA